MLVAVSLVDGHGGVATLQLGSERVHPGGTLEILGDMTAEGPVDIRIVAAAGGDARKLGVASADETGHFQAFLTVPGDLAVGSYLISAHSSSDEARTPVAIVGAPVGDDGGQLPGQDEALAGTAPTAPTSGGQIPHRLATTAATPSAGATDILVPLVAGLAVALVLGTFVRIRARKA
jgi:hypothetical protein